MRRLSSSGGNPFELTARDWVIIVAAALTVSPVLELAKWAERRGWLGELR